MCHAFNFVQRMDIHRSIEFLSIIFPAPRGPLLPHPFDLCPFLQMARDLLPHINTPPYEILNLDLEPQKDYSEIVSRIRLYPMADTMAIVNNQIIR